jgi:two-component system cell cycle response regulator DivK
VVLVVEDDEDLRKLFRDSLIIAGFDAREAEDGLSALQLIESDPPDLVLLDLLLPTLDGYAVREEIAANARTQAIPVVIVTAVASTNYKRLHPARVLRKPVLPDDLVAVVRASLAGAIRQRPGIPHVEK